MRACAAESDPYDTVAVYWKRTSEGLKFICHDRRRGTLTYFPQPRQQLYEITTKKLNRVSQESTGHAGPWRLCLYGV